MKTILSWACILLWTIFLAIIIVPATVGVFAFRAVLAVVELGTKLFDKPKV